MIPAIECDNITFRYFETAQPILEHTSVTIPEGSITVLMGSSGCGKSTLASILCGLLPENGGFLEEGSIQLFGKDLTKLNPSVRAKDISMMFQNPDLQFCMSTLREELYFCLENISVPREEMKSRAEAAAKELEMTAYLDRPLDSLSGGQKQRAVLTCIFLLDAKCILLDEPFANLDPDAVLELMGMLRDMKKRGKTIIAIDHMSDHWIGTADRFVLLGKKGKVICEAETREQLDGCKELFREQGVAYPGIWEETIIEKTPVDEKGYGLYLEDLSMPSVPVKPKKRRFFGKPQTEVKPSLEESLLYEADAYFPDGKIIAIMGPSGCGKTSLMMTLLKQRLYSGKISIREQDGDRELREIGQAGCFEEVGIAFQNPSNQFITQNVTEEVLDGLGRRYAGESEIQLKERALELLDTCSLKPYQEFSPFMLSQGQQRRLAVLSVLAAGQKLLLLDEPTYGQDYVSARALMDQVLHEVRDNGLTVIMTTHDRGLANTYADIRYQMRNHKLTREEDV